MPYIISADTAARLGLPEDVQFEQGEGLVLRQGKSYIRFTFNGRSILVDRSDVLWADESGESARPLVTSAERQLLALPRIPPAVPSPPDQPAPTRARVTGALKPRRFLDSADEDPDAYRPAEADSISGF
jgi:hypothetical protein